MQGSPNATKGLTVFSSSLPTKMEDSIHYGTLGRSPNPHKAWGTHPQLNWRLPINRHQGIHKELATKASTKNTTKPYNLTNTSPPRITVENSNLCTKCKGKSFTLKFQQSYKSYWGNKRGRTQEIHKELQDQDLLCSPHLERILIGGNVDLDLLSLFPQRDSRSIGGMVS